MIAWTLAGSGGLSRAGRRGVAARLAAPAVLAEAAEARRRIVAGRAAARRRATPAPRTRASADGARPGAAREPPPCARSLEALEDARSRMRRRGEAGARTARPGTRDAGAGLRRERGDLRAIGAAYPTATRSSKGRGLYRPEGSRNARVQGGEEAPSDVYPLGYSAARRDRANASIEALSSPSVQNPQPSPNRIPTPSRFTISRYVTPVCGSSTSRPTSD